MARAALAERPPCLVDHVCRFSLSLFELHTSHLSCIIDQRFFFFFKFPRFFKKDLVQSEEQLTEETATFFDVERIRFFIRGLDP